MDIVDIKFNKWDNERLATNKKICITKLKKMGGIGDTFIYNNIKYIIIDIWPGNYSFIKDRLYLLEGANSKNEFDVEFKKKYPKIRDRDIVYAHFISINLNDCGE